ncbi:MAG: 3',5'-cyclic-AMP phosphodiesterase [Pseudomonadales bacterium]|nr:3',5'-cyclic-AMP phosphodiesterase [Pseudomonadales bacterium]
MTRENAGAPVRVVQITDTHLFRDPRAALLKLNTQDSFEKVVDLISANENAIDLILATGDIAQDASTEAYLRFGDAMQPFNAPFYWIPGNHDRRRVMESLAQYEQAFHNLAEIANWQVVMLDSSVVGEVHGHLSNRELVHLEKSLAAATENPSIDHVIVCLHHNPVPGSAGWMSGIGLHNDAAFLSIVDRFDIVRAVVYGHIHQELDFERKKVRYFCTPSTCIQFKPEVTDFTLDDVNPAYRWFNLHTDGRIESGVERVTGHVFEVDHTSTGY